MLTILSLVIAHDRNVVEELSEAESKHAGDLADVLSLGLQGEWAKAKFLWAKRTNPLLIKKEKSAYKLEFYGSEFEHFIKYIEDLHTSRIVRRCSKKCSGAKVMQSKHLVLG